MVLVNHQVTVARRLRPDELCETVRIRSDQLLRQVSNTIAEGFESERQCDVPVELVPPAQNELRSIRETN